MPIKTVFHFANDNVAVCDENGHQMPEFQGRFDEVAHWIVAAARAERLYSFTLQLERHSDFERWEQVNIRHAYPS